MKNLDNAYSLHQQLLSNLKPTFRRDFMDEVSWDEQGVALMGARGVGKTTLLLQYIKEQFKYGREALFVSMDHILMQEYSLYELAEMHHLAGGTHLIIDEIHKYDNWSMHLKSIYDTFPDLKCIVSGSSMLQLYKSKADLSRRFISYELSGLSLREYLQIEHKIKLPVLSLDDILNNHVELAHDLNDKIEPIKDFMEYLKFGYYPIYLKGKNTYGHKLQNVLNTILEVDLPIITGLPVQNVHKIKKLISIIANAVPFQPNISKLAASLELNRTTLYQYLDYLSDSCIINNLNDAAKSYTKLSKPDKIYLHNTNISYSLAGSEVNIGCARETFLLNQLRSNHEVHSSKKGDFLIDRKHTLEIGGRGKSYKQIADMSESYLVSDDILIGTGNRIPIWLFGFLY